MECKFTAIRYCNWCGDPFEVKSPNQKYCHHSNKNCSQEAKRESWRKAAGKYRKKYKNVLQISQVYKLGSGFLSSKPNEDFDKEYLAIVKEKKRLKLNGIIIGLSTGIQFAVRPLMESPLQRSLIPILELYPPILELYPYLLVLAILLVGTVFFGIYYK